MREIKQFFKLIDNDVSEYDYQKESAIVDILDAGLESACLGGHLELAKLLVDEGASYFVNALVAACERRHLELVRIMLTLLQTHEQDEHIVDYCISTLSTHCEDDQKILALLTRSALRRWERAFNIHNIDSDWGIPEYSWTPYQQDVLDKGLAQRRTVQQPRLHNIISAFVTSRDQICSFMRFLGLRQQVVDDGMCDGLVDANRFQDCVERTAT